MKPISDSPLWKLRRRPACRAVFRGLINGFFAAGVVYTIEGLATTFFRITVPDSSEPGPEFWDNFQFFLADWGHPGILITVWVALLLAMQTRRTLPAMSAVGLLSATLISLSIIWRKAESFGEYGLTPVFGAKANPFSLDPTLAVLVPIALSWIVADCIDKVAAGIPTRRKWVKSVVYLVPVIAWFGLTWYGILRAHYPAASVAYMWDMHGTDIPVIYPWLMVISIPVAVLSAVFNMRLRSKRWYWSVIRSITVPIAIAVFLLVLLVLQQSPAQGPTVEYDSPSGFMASGSKLDGRWNGGVSYKDANGTLRREVHFWRGTRHGRWREWDKEGRLVESGFYYGGEKFGPWTWYSDGEVVKSEEYNVFDMTPNYVLGRIPEVEERESPGYTHHVFRYENGDLYEEYTRVFGVVHGEQITWNVDGSLQSSQTWVLGYPVPDEDRSHTYDYERSLAAVELHREFARQLEDAIAELGNR